MTTPTLFSKISITPNLSITRWTRLSTSVFREISVWTAKERLPKTVTSRPTSSRTGNLRLATTTSAPALANSKAMLRPIPVPPPVTIATWPSRDKLGMLIIYPPLILYILMLTLPLGSVKASDSHHLITITKPHQPHPLGAPPLNSNALFRVLFLHWSAGNNAVSRYNH
ncbi:hypothetical protein ES703_116794 [subsurface metagenome]